MHLSFVFAMQIQKIHVTICKIELQVHEVKHQLELLYFQVDEGLVCMDIVSTFHILIITYQSFNAKVFWTI
jgi:hypothetical protein